MHEINFLNSFGERKKKVENYRAGKVFSYFLMYETFMSDLVAQVLWEVGNFKGK